MVINFLDVASMHLLDLEKLCEAFTKCKELGGRLSSVRCLWFQSQGIHALEEYLTLQLHMIIYIQVLRTSTTSY